MTLMALRIAITATPTSPNTASHIVAIPIAPRERIMALTPNAKTIFCQTIIRVFLAMRTANHQSFAEG